jgi:hypothetical protein
MIGFVRGGWEVRCCLRKEGSDFFWCHLLGLGKFLLSANAGYTGGSEVFCLWMGRLRYPMSIGCRRWLATQSSMMKSSIGGKQYLTSL